MKIENYRKNKKMKLRELAKILKVSPQAIWKREKFGIKNSTTAKRYANKLNCDWRELLD